MSNSCFFDLTEKYSRNDMCYLDACKISQLFFFNMPELNVNRKVFLFYLKNLVFLLKLFSSVTLLFRDAWYPIG